MNTGQLIFYIDSDDDDDDDDNDDFVFPLFSFSFYDYPQPLKSKVIWKSMNPHFDFKQQISIPQVGLDLLRYLQTHALVIELWGTQGMSSVLFVYFMFKQKWV